LKERGKYRYAELAYLRGQYDGYEEAAIRGRQSFVSADSLMGYMDELRKNRKPVPGWLGSAASASVGEAVQTAPHIRINEAKAQSISTIGRRKQGEFDRLTKAIERQSRGTL
jgi:hypothetical protein